MAPWPLHDADLQAYQRRTLRAQGGCHQTEADAATLS